MRLPPKRVSWFVAGLGVGGSVAAVVIRTARRRALGDNINLLAEVDRLKREVGDLRAQAEREREARERLAAELTEAHSRITDFEGLEADLRQRLAHASGVRQPDRPLGY
jgi:DNA-binding protein H-NS